MAQPDNYREWLTRYEYTEAAARAENKHPLLTEQTTQTISDGKRRGYNGKRPRTNTIALSDCIVTKADGSQYTIKRGGATSKQATVDREARKLALLTSAGIIGNNE